MLTGETFNSVFLHLAYSDTVLKRIILFRHSPVCGMKT